MPHFSTTVKVPIPEKRKALNLDVISSQAKLLEVFFFFLIKIFKFKQGKSQSSPHAVYFEIVQIDLSQILPS